MPYSSARRILVFSMTRMGDIIQSIPFFRRLRERYPDAEIDLLVEQCFADVAAFLPGVDRTITVNLEDILLCFDQKSDRTLRHGLDYYQQLVASLKEREYDQVWNLTHTRPFTVLSSLIGGSQTRGVTLDDEGLQRVNERWLRYFYATNMSRPWCQFNLVDIYANCVRGVPRDFGRSVAIARTHYENRLPAGYSPRRERRRIALHPGASQKAKAWPAHRWGELAFELEGKGCEIVLVGGKNDQKLSVHFRQSPSLINLIGKTSVAELAAVLSDCDLLISNDSGPMHVAAGVETPVIALTLGSALGSETAPYGENHLVVEPKLHCFPCEASRSCAGQSCAALIEPEFISELADARLQDSDFANLTVPASLRVYRTTFDSEDHQLRLERLGADAESRDQIQNMLRSLWPLWLDGDQGLDIRAVRADELRELLPEAYQRSRAALYSCSRLAELNFDTPASKRRFHQLTSAWLKADSDLTATLMNHPALKSILNYLRIEKGSVEGAGVAAQAKGTAEVYSGLSAMLAPFGDQQGIRNISHKSIDTMEVYHEDLS